MCKGESNEPPYLVHNADTATVYDVSLIDTRGTPTPTPTSTLKRRARKVSEGKEQFQAVLVYTFFRVEDDP